METRKFNTYIDQLLEAHRPHKKQDTRTVRERQKDGASRDEMEPDDHPVDAKRDNDYPTNKHREADVAYKKTLKDKKEDDDEDAGKGRPVSASIYLERLNQLK